MDISYDFHKLTPVKFEELSATVVQYQFNIPQLLTFADGRDGGRDAAARGVDIDMGGSTPLVKQNFVLQAKHTKNSAGKMTDGIVRRVFQGEVKKVQKMVRRGHLDIYIALTNYAITAGQELKLAKKFEHAGAARVVIVGKETLTRWIDESRHLSSEVARLYGIGGPCTREIALRTDRRVQQGTVLLKNKVDQIDENCKNQTTLLKQVHDQQSDGTQMLTHIRNHLQNGSVSHEDIRKPVENISEEMKKQTYLMDHLLQQTSKSQHKPRLVTTTEDDALSHSLKTNLCDNYGLLQNWRFAARNLGISEGDIADINKQNSSIKEQVWQMLTLWQDKCPDKNQVIPHLLKVFRRLRLNAAADEVESLLPV